MAIAKKAVVWGLFAAGGTLSSFLFPALIALFLLIALGMTPGGLQYEPLHAFASGWTGKVILFLVLFLSLWHAAHRLRVVFHDLGIRRDHLVANIVYPLHDRLGVASSRRPARNCRIRVSACRPFHSTHPARPTARRNREIPRNHFFRKGVY